MRRAKRRDLMDHAAANERAPIATLGANWTEEPEAGSNRQQPELHVARHCQYPHHIT